MNDLITSINQSIEHTAKTNRGNAPIKQDTSKPITNAEVKDICSRFEEKKRKYKLDEVLPPMLNARAKALKHVESFVLLCTGKYFKISKRC